MPGRKFPLANKVKASFGDYAMPAFVNQELYDSAISYKPDADDLFVATFPKNGTTWMLYIMSMLYKDRMEIPEGETIFQQYASLDFVGREKTESFPSPRLIKTHFRFDVTPWNDETKYIVVARNPKDTVVSFFYHTVGFEFYDYADGKFDNFFDWFNDGNHDFGDYFDMVPVWWEESKKRKNIYFLLFEDLKTNFESEMLKVAEFIGDEYKEKLLKNDKELLKTIAHKSNIKTMQKSNDIFTPVDTKRPADLPFARKGIIGDWKNVLNEKQSKLLDDRLKNTGIKFPGFDKLWDNYKEYL